jgi:hypothetical protein
MCRRLAQTVLAAACLFAAPGAAASGSDGWTATDTMYLLIGLFSGGFLVFFILGLVICCCKRRSATAPSAATAQNAEQGKKSKQGKQPANLEFPDVEEDPSTFWSSNINDVNEPMRHFYPSSSLFQGGNGNADKFSGY